MSSLMDMMLNMQNGEAVQQLSRQFQLSQEQTVQAMEALMPAFSQGLKRNAAADPFGVANFLNALSSGHHGSYVDDMQRAFGADGLADGNGILGHLFGSKEVSRAVAAQAAMATGIGETVLKQMLPALATMVMGGLFKQSTGQMSAAPSGFGAGGNPIGALIEQMMRQAGTMPGSTQSPRTPRAEPHNPFDNPFGKVLESMFGGGQARQPQPDPFADNPLGRIFQEMLGGAGQPKTQAREPRGAQRTNPSGRPRTPYDDLFGDIFESGRRARDDYERNMESIFDQFLSGMDRHR